MSHHRHYNYNKPGSEEGLRRDIRRRRWHLALMIVLGLLVIAGLLYFTLLEW